MTHEPERATATWCHVAARTSKAGVCMIDRRRLAGRLPRSLAVVLGLMLLRAVIVVVLLKESREEPGAGSPVTPEATAAVPPADPVPTLPADIEPQPEALKASPQSSGLHSLKFAAPPDAVDVTVVDA